jgi:hypothetical protein
MTLRTILGGAGLSFLALATAAAQTVSIEHDPIGCIVANNYPELNACFRPSSDVARARVQFRAAGTLPWYYVEMHQGGACFSGMLPKPESSTRAIEYYIDVASKGYGESRTADYAPRVASGIAGCKRRGMVAAFATSATAVRVFAPNGAPSVPAGFSGAGVVTTTGAATGPAASGGGPGSGPGTSPASGGDTSAASHGSDHGSSADSGHGGGGGGGGGAIVPLVLVGAAAAGAAIYVATKKPAEEQDADGDGFSTKDGDCDDHNKDISPNGGFAFTVDFAWTGANLCGATNPRAQTYRVQNRTCSTITVSRLTLQRSGSGALCQDLATPTTETLAVTSTSVPSGATTVIRTGAAAGTAGSICCDLTTSSPTNVTSAARSCATGTCTVTETYTLATSAGNATASNSFVVNGPNGCTVCGTQKINDWPFAPSAAEPEPERAGSRWSPRPVD